MIVTLGYLAQVSTYPFQLVLACGCFDVFTIGHVRHLKAAKSLGLQLAVLVTADRNVNKPGRPLFPEGLRAEVVDSLRCVDYTIVNPYSTAAPAILQLSPSVYVKGREYRGQSTPALEAEREAMESVGGRLEFTETLEMHTTDVLGKLVDMV